MQVRVSFRFGGGPAEVSCTEQFYGPCEGGQ